MRRGFNLIEVLIACMLLVVAVTPLAMLYQQSQRETSLSYQELQAASLGRELITNLKTMHQIIGYDAIGHLGNHSKPEKWVDLSNPDRAALFVDSRHPVVKVGSKLILSPIPQDFRRLIRIYQADASINDKVYQPVPDLKTVEVKIEWKAPLTQEFNRSIIIKTLLDRDEVLPPFVR